MFKKIIPFLMAMLMVASVAWGVPTYDQPTYGTSNALTASVGVINDSVGAYNYNADNYIAVTAPLTSATWNTVAAHEILTITGAVKLFIVAEITTADVTGVGAITFTLGSETTPASIIASTDGTLLDVGEIWDTGVDGTITAEGLPAAMGVEWIIANGDDVGYTIGTTAALTGIIVFHVWWTPLNGTGAVVAGAGGVL